MRISITLRRGVQLSPAVFATLLVFNFVVLFLVHAIDEHAMPRFVEFFHFDYEQNAPTVYSVILILLAALVCYAISKSTLTDRRYWLTLSIIFAYLAIDEFVIIHERIGRIIREAF